MCPTPPTTARSRCCGLGANGVLSSRFQRKKGCSSGGEAGPSGLGPWLTRSHECAVEGCLELEDASRCLNVKCFLLAERCSETQN